MEYQPQMHAFEHYIGAILLNKLESKYCHSLAA